MSFFFWVFLILFRLTYFYNLVIKTLRKKMFTMVPRFQTASEEALGSREGESVKPAGWAPQTWVGGAPRCLWEDFLTSSHTCVPWNDSAGEGDWCAEPFCLARGRAGRSLVRAWAVPHQLPLVFQHLVSSRPPECLSFRSCWIWEMLIGIIPHGPSIVLGLEFLVTCPFPKSHLLAFCMPSPALYSTCPQSVVRTVYFCALVRSAKGPEGWDRCAGH